MWPNKAHVSQSALKQQGKRLRGRQVRGRLLNIPRFNILHAVLREDSFYSFLPSLRIGTLREDVSQRLVGPDNDTGG